jgi:C4-dicarboxylate transporter DctM subunit
MIGTAFSLLIGLMALSLPVAAALGLMGYILSQKYAFFPLTGALGELAWNTSNDFILIAAPMFIMMGELMHRSGMSERLFTALAPWFDRVPGRLIHTNVAACAVFAATSGSSVATAATIGTVALPALEQRRYDRARSLGSLAAGGTLGILIPPSVAMLISGSLTNNSVGKLFIAGIIPGVLLTGCFMAYIALSDLFGGKRIVEERVSLGEKIRRSKDLIAPFLIFGVVMGSLYLGLATPTESASLGVVMALALARVSGRLDGAMLTHCFRQTATLTGTIILIICGAFILNVTLSLVGIPQKLTQIIAALSINPFELFLILTVFYLVLGCFLEVLSMQVTTIPIVYPIATAVGIDPIWLGIYIVLMSELAMITPPVGMNLYVVQSIRQDGGSIADVIRGVVPYVFIMLGFTFLLWFLPGLVLWLPRQMVGV